MNIKMTDSLDDGRVTFEEPEAEPARRIQAIDPVCGMSVDPDDPKTIKLDRNGLTFYFCSKECEQTFAKAPEEFIAAT